MKVNQQKPASIDIFLLLILHFYIHCGTSAIRHLLYNHDKCSIRWQSWKTNFHQIIFGTEICRWNNKHRVLRIELKEAKKWRWAGKKIESICKEKESHELEMSIFDRVYKTVCGKPSEREKLCKLSLSYSICFSVTFSNSKKLVRSVSQSFRVCICVSLSVSLFLRGSLFSANSLSSSFVAPNVVSLVACDYKVVNEKKLVWNSFFTPKSTYDWYKT